ncbi:MAG: Holliday junction branch migration protein RuvA [Corynebacterium sp.]|nr:Holliday junction branch migration protein RuvA [Corynebacterium sp.]
MIVSLRGTIIDITLHHAVVECGGVGYQVLATPATLGKFTRGEEAFVLITMIVREESQTLYGFLDTQSREMFSILQTVSGLGPKLALAAQSVYSTSELAHAITHSDAKALQKIPGVGKRMAERMVVDLKDKVKSYDVSIPDTTSTPTTAPTGTTDVAEQVLAALVGLGFSEKVAEPVLHTVLVDDPTLTTAAALRATLSALGQK